MQKKTFREKQDLTMCAIFLRMTPNSNIHSRNNLLGLKSLLLRTQSSKRFLGCNVFDMKKVQIQQRNRLQVISMNLLYRVMCQKVCSMHNDMF